MNYKLALAGMLATASMYMQVPLLMALFDGTVGGLTPFRAAAIVAVPGLGVFAFGCFCSYLVQHFRRNVVCIASLFGLAACTYGLYYLLDCVLPLSGSSGFLVPLVVRFVQGAVFGLAQMVLSSTLIIDTCKSPRRTAANQAAAWFSRFALVLGPLLVLLMFRFSGAVCSMGGSFLGLSAGVSVFKAGMLVAAALCVVAALLVMSVRFPFKAPEDIVPHVSADRFFLKDGAHLFVNLTLVTAAVGVVLCMDFTFRFYLMLASGLFVALLAEHTFLSGMGLGGVVKAGMAVVLLSSILFLCYEGVLYVWVAPFLLGCGLGLSGARFLSLFITLSLHCRRGTAQSTFFLGWEFGLYAGIFLACGVQAETGGYMHKLAFILAFAALTMYGSITHRWYMEHKNR